MAVSGSGRDFPVGQSSGLTLAVPQCTYAIAKIGTPVECLTTKNIWSCLGLVGVNRDTGVAFCAHLDTIASVLGLPSMLRDVERINGGDLDGFEIHDIAGVPPWYSGALLALALLAFVLGEWYAGLLALVPAVAFGHVRVCTWWILKTHMRLPATRVKHRPMGFIDILRKRVSVRVVAGGEVTAEKTTFGRAPVFDVPCGPGGGRTFRLLKADASL